jgi:hypothetical protein
MYCEKKMGDNMIEEKVKNISEIVLQLRNAVQLKSRSKIKEIIDVLTVEYVDIKRLVQDYLDKSY